MSRRPTTLFLSMALLFPAVVAAQTASTPAIGTAKIAFVDLQQAVFTCEEGKRDLAEVQNYVNKMNSQLQEMQKKSEELKNQLQVQGPKLTDEARQDLQTQIEDQDVKLQRFSQDTQKEINRRRDRVMNEIGNKVVQVIQAYAKEKGLSAIFYHNPQQRDLWVDPSMIVTDEIVKRYNETHPVAAGTTKP